MLRCPSCDEPITYLTSYSLVRFEVLQEDDVDDLDDDDTTVEVVVAQQEDANVYASVAAVEAGIAVDPSASVEDVLSIFCPACSRHYGLPAKVSVSFQ